MARGLWHCNLRLRFKAGISLNIVVHHQHYELKEAHKKLLRLHLKICQRTLISPRKCRSLCWVSVLKTWRKVIIRLCIQGSKRQQTLLLVWCDSRKHGQKVAGRKKKNQRITSKFWPHSFGTIKMLDGFWLTSGWVHRAV